VAPAKEWPHYQRNRIASSEICLHNNDQLFFDKVHRQMVKYSLILVNGIGTIWHLQEKKLISPVPPTSNKN
jgi:hypothetical protein